MGGRVADSIARVAHAMPTRPAAASAWPADDLCAASATGSLFQIISNPQVEFSSPQDSLN